MSTLADLTIHEALDLLDSREISAFELTQAVLSRVAATEDRVHAYLNLDAEGALAQAAKADKERLSGLQAALLGIPIAVKDNISTQGIETTCGSKILKGYIPPFDATAIKHLKDAGAVILGKTNQDEFAMGSSTENSGYGVTHNPWNLDRVPGGSSGGSAAAVSVGEALGALGTDTGGSVRQPAAFCGIVGLRPSYGRISRYGLIAFASSLDQIGPLTRDVEDAALLLSVLAGADPRDSTCRPNPVPTYTEGLDTGIKGLRIGIPTDYLAGQGIQPAVAKALKEALACLEEAGAELVELRLPHTQYGIATYYLIATAEASTNLARFDGVRYGIRIAEEGTLEQMYAQTRGQGLGEEVKRRIMLGTYTLSAGYYDAYYIKAQKVRTLIKQDFDQAFEQVDILVGPTTPTTAFKLGEHITDPLQMYLEDIFTIPPALAGIPCMSVPCGFDAEGLPVGLQFMAPPMEEAQLLKAAYAYEKMTRWNKRRPVLC
ncbi:MAG: Asp-tRNA(Asn)/Glu-tRNA(Gln) amidotransferase subunit GatA [Anaerolineae bacterium]|nr:Asp-tRNA(Asn)/Glu-tRNA(Gln) amidotransferase subunit GatA [Anaerolineae bacterium]